MFTSWELVTMSFMNITKMVQNGTPLLENQLPIPFTPVGVIADGPGPMAYDLAVLLFAYCYCFLLLENTIKEQKNTIYFQIILMVIDSD